MYRKPCTGPITATKPGESARYFSGIATSTSRISTTPTT
jgi:hypothetical protein